MAVDTDHTREGGVWEKQLRRWVWHDDRGLLHREDGPAVVWEDGRQEWWSRGRWHRVDGPAVIYADGSHEWFVHGLRHRADGPAVMHANGSQSWYVLGSRITEEVAAWMRANNITLPFTEEQRVEFGLRWG